MYASRTFVRIESTLYGLYFTMRLRPKDGTLPSPPIPGKSSLDRHHRQRGEDAVAGIELHGHSDAGEVKTQDPANGPPAITFTDPLTTSPRPWGEIVSFPRGSISVQTVRLPSAVTSRYPVTSTTDSAAMRLPPLS